jgi:hypothetical protein
VDPTNAQIGVLSRSSFWTSCHSLSLRCVPDVSRALTGSTVFDFGVWGVLPHQHHLMPRGRRRQLAFQVRELMFRTVRRALVRR